MKTKILIQVEGGVVQNITSNNPNIEIYVADQDNLYGGGNVSDLFAYYRDAPDKTINTNEFKELIKQLEIDAEKSVRYSRELSG